MVRDLISQRPFVNELDLGMDVSGSVSKQPDRFTVLSQCSELLDSASVGGTSCAEYYLSTVRPSERSLGRLLELIQLPVH